MARVRAIMTRGGVGGVGESTPKIFLDWFYRAEDMRGLGWSGSPAGPGDAQGLTWPDGVEVPEVFLSEHNDWVEAGGVLEPCRVICVAAGSPEHRKCVESFKKKKTATYCCFHYFNVDTDKPVSIPLKEYVARRKVEGSGAGRQAAEAARSAERCDMLIERTVQDLRGDFPEVGITEISPVGGEEWGRGDAEKVSPPPEGSSVPAAKRPTGDSRDARPAKAAKTGPQRGGAGAAAAAKATGPAADIVSVLKDLANLGPGVDESKLGKLRELADNLLRRKPGQAETVCSSLNSKQKFSISKCLSDSVPGLLRKRGDVGDAKSEVMQKIAETGVLKVQALSLKYSFLKSQKEEVRKQELQSLDQCLQATLRLPIPSKEVYLWLKAEGLGKILRDVSIDTSMPKSVKNTAKTLIDHWCEYIVLWYA